MNALAGKVADAQPLAQQLHPGAGLLCHFQTSAIDVGLGDGQDRARRVAEHVLADGAQDPRYPLARRQDNELGVHCLGDADQGASGQVCDDAAFHPPGRIAERVADGLAEQVLGDGPVVGAGEPLGCGPTAGDQPRSAG